MSVRVVHTFGRNAGAVATLDRPVIRFGRSPDNDVVFDPEHDRDASSHHAELRREGGAWVLVDLNSRNGTYVGGRRISRQALGSGDEVTFGAKGPRVRIELAAAPANAARPSAPLARTEGMAAYAPPAPQQAPHAAPPAAPPAGARVGQRTMAFMIQSAVAAATGRARPRRTVEISAMVEKEVQAATAGQRRTTWLLAALLLVALAGLGALILYNRASHDEITRLREELAGLAPEDPRRKDIERRLGTLHPSNANFGRNLYELRKKGVFMLASGGSGFCTAFAVRPSVLATNAHCVRTAKRRGGVVIAVENEGRGQVSFPVTDMRAHPGYRDEPDRLTPDVGVVIISGRAAVVLEVAAAQELAAAGAGDDVYIIGFPGRLMDAQNPSATFLAAHIGRITGAAGRPAPRADAWLIQHDAPTTHGTSGSPIFNGSGKVIGVNAGSYLENDDETIAGRKTEVVKASPYKFGMRIDLIEPLLR